MARVFFLLLLMMTAGCGGCAMPAFLEVPSALLSLGSLGNTAVQAYYAAYGDKKIAVARMPRQYLNDYDRMLIETWESGYQLVKSAVWQGADRPWHELVELLDKEGKPLDATLVLVRVEFSHQQPRQEKITFYISEDGQSLTPSGQEDGPAFYTETRDTGGQMAVLNYTAYFFAKSRQPSGIMAVQGPWDGPCRTPRSYGALIKAVERNSPAYRAGLLPGDIIHSVNGSEADFHNLYFLLKPGLNDLRLCRRGDFLEKKLQLPAAQAKNGR